MTPPTPPSSTRPESVSVPAPRRRGRPPDQSIDQRALDAGLELFAELGWSGFNLDGVARRAKVGKAAIYRRWPNREALITDALERIVMPDLNLDTGSLRGDLMTLATYIWQLAMVPSSGMLLRVAIEARSHPDVFGPRLAEVLTQQNQAGRAIIRRAVERGEIPEGVPSRVVFHALSGAIQNRLLFTAPEQLAAVAAQRDEILTQIVDFLIAGMLGWGQKDTAGS